MESLNVIACLGLLCLLAGELDRSGTLQPFHALGGVVAAGYVASRLFTR